MKNECWCKTEMPKFYFPDGHYEQYECSECERRIKWDKLNVKQKKNLKVMDRILSGKNIDISEYKQIDKRLEESKLSIWDFQEMEEI
jgi:hypothetical protein